MPSKKRGGLSAREYKAKQLGGSLNYKSGGITVKQAVRRPAQRSVAQNLGLANQGEDLENAQLRSGVNADNSTYGPTYDQTSKYYSPSVAKSAEIEKTRPKNRSLAQQAFNTVLGINTAQAAPSLSAAFRGQSTPGLSVDGGTGGAKSGLLGEALHYGKEIVKGLPIVGPLATIMPDLNLSEEAGRFFGNSPESVNNTFKALPPKASDYDPNFTVAPTVIDPSRGDLGHPGITAETQPYEDTGLSGGNGYTFGPKKDTTGDQSNIGHSAADEAARQLFQNLPQGADPEMGIQNPSSDTKEVQPINNPSVQDGYGMGGSNAPGSTLSNYGSGWAGNGALTSSSKGMGIGKEYKDSARLIKKNLNNLLEELDKEYSLNQKMSEDELNKSKNDDLSKLVSVMAGNNTADSEQRLQLQNRLNSDYASQLSNLLAKLQVAKSKDAAGYRSDATDKLTNLREALMKAKQESQNKEFDQWYKMQLLSKRGAGRGNGNKTGQFYSAFDPRTGQTVYRWRSPQGADYNISPDQYLNGKYGPAGQSDGGEVDPSNMTDEELRQYYNSLP